MTKSRILISVAAIIIAAASLAVVGCMSTEEADQARVESSETVAQFERDLDGLRIELAAAEASGDADAIERSEKSVALMEKILEHARRGDDILQATINPDGTINIEAAAQQTAPYLPFPWNVGLLLAAGVATRLHAEIAIRRLREAQKQAEQDRDSIILGIDAARSADSNLAKLMKENKGDMLEHYTDSAYERVEKLSVT